MTGGIARERGLARRGVELIDHTQRLQRIVHVADAYDAMTSDRPYRRGMSHEEAIRVLEQYAGTQFDAAIVPVFTNLAGIARTERAQAGVNSLEVRSLAEALNGDRATASPQRSEEVKNA